VEHTKRVIYLEDDDVAAVADGNLTIHRYIQRSIHMYTLTVRRYSLIILR
jgi:hypothetical protein